MKATYKRISTLLSLSLIADLLIYFSSSLIVRSVSILIMPALLRLLPAYQFGKLALVTSFTSVGTAILGLGLRQVLAIDFFGLTKEKQKEMINHIVLLYSAIAIPCIALLIYYAQAAEPLLFTGSSDPMRIASLYIFFSFFAELTYQWLQYQQRAWHLMVIQVNSVFLVLLCTYLFVWIFNLDITGVLLAQLVGLSIPVGTGIYLYYTNEIHAYQSALKIKSSIQYLKRGIPFIQTVLFAWILAAGDRWMLARMSSLTSVGIYAVADMVSQLFYLFILYPWTAAYLPYMLKEYHTQSIVEVEQRNRTSMIVTILGLTILIGCGSLLLQPMVYILLPSAYHQAVPLMYILLFGQLALLAGYFSSCLLQFYKKGAVLACLLGISAGTNIILNAIMIPYYDVYGCAYATSISYLLYFVLTFAYNCHLFAQQENR